MKRLLISIGILAALSLNTASGLATTGPTQKTRAKTAAAKTVIGYISDSSCGLQHMAGMNEKDCTLMCVKNGKFVLADRDRKVVYQLDKVGQEKAKEFAGQKVKITGRVTGKTIRVTAIEAAT
ncbi:MAG TPA: hypothetical protein VJV03_09260 [Pyrinomonadaceae bacterium]|nr:hypothetical protein [Pyrinomonadaceae bacterium]